MRIGALFKTRETQLCETPANLAISVDVIAIFLPFHIR